MEGRVVDTMEAFYIMRILEVVVVPATITPPGGEGLTRFILTLSTSGTRPSTASESTVRHARPSPRPRTSSGDQRGARGAQQEGRSISAWRGVRQLPEERTADVEAVRGILKKQHPATRFKIAT